MEWRRIRVVHGPVVVGRFIARAVEAFNVGGGHLKSAEVWCGHCWDSGAVETPSFNAVVASLLAGQELLAAAGVPIQPFPPGYEPLASCSICVGVPLCYVE